ncbi:MAG: hypothetical protein ACKPB0_11055 [Opitutaceae bacterium]
MPLHFEIVFSCDDFPPKRLLRIPRHDLRRKLFFGNACGGFTSDTSDFADSAPPVFTIFPLFLFPSARSSRPEPPKPELIYQRYPGNPRSKTRRRLVMPSSFAEPTAGMRTRATNEPHLSVSIRVHPWLPTREANRERVTTRGLPLDVNLRLLLSALGPLVSMSGSTPAPPYCTGHP